jgi:hypothetical protein
MRHRNGISSIAFLMLAAVVFGILAMCVDYGLKVVVDSELQTAADSSAIAGCQQLLDCGQEPGYEGSIVAAAKSSALASATTAGKIEPGGLRVELGAWDVASRSFAPAAIDDADAVRMTVTRSAALGNAVPNPMGSVVGLPPLVATRQAVARVEMVPEYSLIGLDKFVARGVLTVNGLPWTGKGSIASNGDVELNLLGLIGVTIMDGHISTRGQVKLPLISALTIIKDGIRRPSKPFVLPPVTLDWVKTHNNNNLLGSALNGSGDFNALLNTDIPAGTYYFRNFNVIAGVQLRATGPVTIYVAGDVNLVGSVNISGNNPENFKIRVGGDGHVFIAANVVLPADIYAPESDITIGAGVFYNGRLIGKTLTILGTSLFSLLPDLPPPELGRSRVVLVK